MPVYTRTGDKGFSSTLSEERRPKSDPVFEVNGWMDHLNAALGAARAELNQWSDAKPVVETLKKVQMDLFSLGAYVSSGHDDYLKSVWGSAEIFEAQMDKLMPHFKLDGFVLPGDTRQDAALHVARTTCRTLERRLTLLDDPRRDDCVPRYINRLSDLLFVYALWAANPEPRLSLD